MYCFINIEFGNDYQKNCQKLLKEISVLTDTKGLLYKNIFAFLTRIFDDISYMKQYFHHTVSSDLLHNLKSLRGSLTQLQFVETKKYNFLKEDLDATIEIKQTVCNIINMINIEKTALSEKLSLNPEEYKSDFLNRFGYHNDFIKNIPNSCDVKQFADIKKLISDDITYTFYYDFLSLFEAFVSSLKQHETYFKTFDKMLDPTHVVSVPPSPMAPPPSLVEEHLQD
jgi:hypothetical protein